MNNTNSIPQETLNNVLIDMLRGAKDASSEIYAASKTGIVKAVDFAQEQAPLVMQEFLAWRFSQAIIYLIVGVIALALLVGIVKKCLSKDWLSASDGGSLVGGVFGIAIFALVFGTAIVPAVETIVKIKVAPRVYVIEWVADQVSHKNNNDRQTFNRTP